MRALDAQGSQPFLAQETQYDAWGRPVEDVLGQQRYRYDEAGRLIEMRDVMDRSTHIAHDVWGRIQQVSAGQGAEQAHTQLHYSSGRAEQVQGLTAPNGAHTERELDDWGRVVRHHSPDTGTTHMRYNEAGQLIQHTDAQGHVVTWQRDAAGRERIRVSRQAPNPGPSDSPPEVVVSRYHGAYLIARANQHQSDGWGYDRWGRVVAQTTLIQPDSAAALSTSTPSSSPGQPSKALRFDTRYSYDAQGRLTEKQLPDGARLQLSWAAGSALQAVHLQWPEGRRQAILSEVEVNSLHGLRQVRYGNGVHSTWQRDERGRMSGVTTRGAQTPLFQQTLGFDPAGRITRNDIQTGGPAAGVQTYGYDSLDRLVSARYPAVFPAAGHAAGDSASTQTLRWTFDANGNRLSQQHRQERGSGQGPEAVKQTSVSYAYAPQSNRLLSMKTGEQPPQAWRLNANGSPLEAPEVEGGVPGRIRHERYNADNRRVEVRIAAAGAQEPADVQARYAYNAQGERMMKAVSGPQTTTRSYTLYSHHQRSADVDEQGRITAHYVYLGHMPVAKIETPAQGESRVLSIHSNHLGAPHLMTDAQQRVVWRASYEPYGQAAIAPDPDQDGQATRLDLRLPGQWWDEETGTHYNVFRDYEPGLGRYLQSDPLGFNEDGFNIYLYARSDPISRVDILGLASCVYEICKHTLTCSPDNKENGGPVTLGPVGLFSGQGDCKNSADPACINNKNDGPIPPGKYTMNKDERKGKEGFWRLEPNPKIPGWKCYFGTRCGFQLHPGSISLGCITADKKDKEAIAKYNEIDELLLKEQGSNNLTVVACNG